MSAPQGNTQSEGEKMGLKQRTGVSTARTDPHGGCGSSHREEQLSLGRETFAKHFLMAQTYLADGTIT